MVHKATFSKLELMQGRVKSVPEDWQFMPLEKAYKIRNQLRLPINEEERFKQQGTYPYYGPTKIQDYLSTYQQDGDYALIGEDGDHFLKYRTQSMTQVVSGKCTVNNHAHIVEETPIATRLWFYYYFMHRDIFSFLTRQGAGRYKLNKQALARLPILLPPLPEQKKIAKILSAWDDSIVTTEQLLANSQQQKKALMQQLLTGKKRFPGFEKEWDTLQLGDLFSRVTKKNSEVNTNVVTISAQQGLIRQEEFFKKTVASDILNNYFLLEKGQFAYNKSYSNGYPMGAIKRLNRYEKGVVTTLYICFEVSDFERCCPIYFEQYFDSGLLNRGLSQIAHEGGRAHGLLNVKPSDFFKLKVPTPSLREQKVIAKTLTIADAEITTLQQKLDRLKEEKKALMQQLLTGKRRVKVEEEAVA